MVLVCCNQERHPIAATTGTGQSAAQCAKKIGFSSYHQWIQKTGFSSYHQWIKTHKSFKRTLFIGTKHNMQIFRVIPFIKLQNDT